MTKLRKLLLVATAISGMVTATASPASAAYNDDFTVPTLTPGNCGSSPAGYAYFIDWGEGGLADPAWNDDYIVLRDTCRDGDGIIAFAFLNSEFLGERYNGKGFDGFVVWDPFAAVGNVDANQNVSIRVCSVNGQYGEPYDCNRIWYVSRDG
ncbi:MAG TPA: hypothetical protein VF062_17045 [Candidatus Limnocylindrales bacterium]